MKTFKNQLDELADFALEINGIKNDYTQEDLSNATLVFMEVLSSLMFDHYIHKLTEDQMIDLFTEFGLSMRQSILLSTGIDLHKIFTQEEK